MITAEDLSRLLGRPVARVEHFVNGEIRLIEFAPAACPFVEELRRYAEPTRPVNLDKREGPKTAEWAE